MFVDRRERVLSISRRQAKADPELRDKLLATLYSLHGFARSLCGDRERTDDLVQETILKAWKNIARFERGSNLQACFSPSFATTSSRNGASAASK